MDKIVEELEILNTELGTRIKFVDNLQDFIEDIGLYIDEYSRSNEIDIHFSNIFYKFFIESGIFRLLIERDQKDLVIYLKRILIYITVKLNEPILSSRSYYNLTNHVYPFISYYNRICKMVLLLITLNAEEYITLNAEELLNIEDSIDPTIGNLLWEYLLYRDYNIRSHILSLNDKRKLYFNIRSSRAGEFIRNTLKEYYVREIIIRNNLIIYKDIMTMNEDLMIPGFPLHYRYAKQEMDGEMSFYCEIF